MKLQCRLRIILAEHNMKQLDLLKQMDEPISHASLSQIVQGKNLPTLITALQIAKALKMPIEEIWLEVPD
ncbi:helix-turn-helix transcriptional regulator [Brevibacillus laterosporus]|uniref:helix-turn-helix transcriptional regulator n=1 Tax=Brevibacillus laterosporus TaxID=1465 RepID=UPI002E2078FC|nr:helix-turn-helix transcriptional regulator [Brevibacillus laterosporus]MED1670449.1 helix-turn-helix transcriptional regulator [Brevibacillus laterosporus]MED1720673.1 helix-turn-helix transcriptional regulator [Brevibacillus laterosporus]